MGNVCRTVCAAVLLALMLFPVVSVFFDTAAAENSYPTDEHHKFTVTFDIPDVSNCDHYLIEFGDGDSIDSLVDDTSSVVSTYDMGSDTWNFRVTHTYPEVVGTYTMEFTAFSESGETATNGLNVSLLGYPVITFVTNGGNAIDPITVENGEDNGGTPADRYYTRATAPDDPVKEGSVFAGWYTDSGLHEVWDWNYLVTDDVTLYAAWDLPDTEYTITFYVDRAVYSETTVGEGETIVLPAEPSKEGYRFIGWKGYSEGMTATSDRGFCALWESLNPVTYSVSYTVSGVQYSGYVVAGGSIDFSPPMREGYSFKGWYADAALTIPLEGTAVDSDMTVYPKYVQEKEGSFDVGTSIATVMLALIGVCVAAAGSKSGSRLVFSVGCVVFAVGVASLGACMFGVIR